MTTAEFITFVLLSLATTTNAVTLILVLRLHRGR